MNNELVQVRDSSGSRRRRGIEWLEGVGFAWSTTADVQAPGNDQEFDCSLFGACEY